MPAIDLPVCQHIDQKPANKRRRECHSEISWAVKFRKGRLWINLVEHKTFEISARVLIDVTGMRSLARFVVSDDSQLPSRWDRSMSRADPPQKLAPQSPTYPPYHRGKLTRSQMTRQSPKNLVSNFKSCLKSWNAPTSMAFVDNTVPEPCGSAILPSSHIVSLSASQRNQNGG